MKMDYATQFKHDGTLHDLKIHEMEIPTCSSCGTKWLGGEEDERVEQALREKVGLLSCSEIRAHRKRLGLSQEQLAERLGTAKESVSRWETGALIQSVIVDKLLRMFFKYPADPVWGQGAVVCDTVADAADSNLSARKAVATWKATLAQAYQSAFTPTDYFHELRDSVERVLLSVLMFDASRIPDVESRVSEEDFQDVVLRQTYRSMCSVFHESGTILPRKVAERLSARISSLPIEPNDVLCFLVDTAAPNTRVEELVELMSRRSQIRRELQGLI